MAGLVSFDAKTSHEVSEGFPLRLSAAETADIGDAGIEGLALCAGDNPRIALFPPIPFSCTKKGGFKNSTAFPPVEGGIFPVPPDGNLEGAGGLALEALPRGLGSGEAALRSMASALSNAAFMPRV